MANKDAAFGFRPLRNFGSSSWNGKVSVYYAPSTYATSIFKGDPVVVTGTADPTGRYPEVNLATSDTAANPITGIAIGFGSSPNLAANLADLNLSYGALSTNRYVYVVDDPDVVFACQEDGNMGIVGVGSNVNFLLGSGSTVTGLSGAELDSSDAATTPGLQIRVLRAVGSEDNDATAANAVWECMINVHTFRSATADDGTTLKGMKGI